jgi:hypothetical protein
MAALLLALVIALQPAVVVDRTLAIVAGRTITLSDARVAVTLGLVEGRMAAPDAVEPEVVERLVNRELMLREADRYQPPPPPPEAIEAGVAAARARAGGEQALAAVLDAGGFSEARLRAWVRDDRRIEAYMRQRFASDERRDDLIADWLSDLRRRAPVVVLPPQDRRR